MSEKDKLKAIYIHFMELAQTNEPKMFVAYMMGTVANIVGNMSQEYFDEMTKVEPCGRVGCDCHLGIMDQGCKCLRLLREDWEAHKPQQTEVA